MDGLFGNFISANAQNLDERAWERWVFGVGRAQEVGGRAGTQEWREEGGDGAGAVGREEGRCEHVQVIEGCGFVRDGIARVRPGGQRARIQVGPVKVKGGVAGWCWCCARGERKFGMLDVIKGECAYADAMSRARAREVGFVGRAWWRAHGGMRLVVCAWLAPSPPPAPIVVYAFVYCIIY